MLGCLLLSYRDGKGMMMMMMMMKMMMKCQIHWWRKSEYPEETNDLRQVTGETFTHGHAPSLGADPGRSGVKPGDQRCHESNALHH